MYASQWWVDSYAQCPGLPDERNSAESNHDRPWFGQRRREVRLSSNGSVTIRVRDYLRANLSSSGDLHYIGNPTVDATANSSGDVVRIGE